MKSYKMFLIKDLFYKSMKINNIFLAMVLILMLLPMINAESSFVFKENNDVDLKIPVLNSDNSIVTSSTNCYITVRDPEETMVVSEGLMTFNTGGIYNYTIINTTLNGEYSSSVRCDNGADYGFTSFSFEITPSGNNLDTSESIISLVGVGIMIFVCIIFLILAVAFTQTGVKLFFLGLSLTTMVFTTGYVLSMMRQTIGTYMSFTSAFSSFYSLLTILLIGGSIGLLLYLIVFAFTKFYEVRGYYD